MSFFFDGFNRPIFPAHRSSGPVDQDRGVTYVTMTDLQKAVGLNHCYTTSTRPSAAAVGQGTSIYDATLQQPVWSDGTTWRDAMGNDA